MKLWVLLGLIWLVVTGGVGTARGYVMDTPHNESNGIVCVTCHGAAPFYVTDWAARTAANPDDTRANAVCLMCHDEASTNPLKGPAMAMHASSTLPGSTTWSTECTQCHDQHSQGQLDWINTDGNSLFLATGSFQTLAAIGGSPLTYTPGATGADYTTIGISATITGDPGWTNPTTWNAKGGHVAADRAADGSRGLVLVPNKGIPNETFEIIGATPTSVNGKAGYLLKVKGQMVVDAFQGGVFGVIYGQALRSQVIPNGGTSAADYRDVKFFVPDLVAGTYGGYVDLTPGTTKPVGLCQVCHESTSVYRKDGTSDGAHNPGTNCSTCHNIVAGGPVTAGSAGSVEVTAISGSTSESGTTATFQVRLGSQPTANVIIPVSSSDLTEGTVDKSSLTFTSANWNVNQTVTVTGVADSLADGDVAYQINLGPTSSADPSYNGLIPASVAVVNTDVRTAGFVVGPISGNTSESGATATFTVRLASQPTANVTIPVASSDLTEGTVDKSSLVFTNSNWNSDQTVTVTGVADNLADGDVTYRIDLGPTSSVDALYNNLSPGSVSLLNLDVPLVTQPPINITMDLHCDPFYQGLTLEERRSFFERQVANATWLLDTVEPYGVKISFLAVGEFYEFCNEAGEQATCQPLLARLRNSGGILGTHSHAEYRRGSHDWPTITNAYGNPAESDVRLVWDTNKAQTDAAIQSAFGLSDPTAVAAVNTASESHSQLAEPNQLMTEYGYTIREGGADQLLCSYFSHVPWNPYRPGETAIDEDFATPFVTIPQGMVIGQVGEHLGRWQDGAATRKQAEFLQIYANWKERNLTGSAPKVWSFGWGVHTQDLDEGSDSRAAITALIPWLHDEFVVRSDASGQPPARFASYTSVRDEFLAWEAAHPGVSSFNYGAVTTDYSQYPYLEWANRYLRFARLDSRITATGADVFLFKAGNYALTTPTTYQLILANATGMPVTVDLSSVFGAGSIKRIKLADGSVSDVAATTVNLDAEPVVLCTGSDSTAILALETAASPALVSIALSPAAANLSAGISQLFLATGTYSDSTSQSLAGAATWSSSNPAVATVGKTGQVTTIAVGTTTISATAGGITGSTTLNVRPALTAIAVSPANPSLVAGATQQFIASGTFTDNSHQVISTLVAWSSSNPAVATIGSTGLATSLAAGQTTITASLGGVSGGTTLTVTGGGSASVSRITTQQGIPTLFINNQAVAPTSLFVYNVEQTVAYDAANWLTTFQGYVDKAKSTGMTYLSFELYFHASMFPTATQPIVAGSELDFANLDSLFNYAQQQGIYLLPTIWVDNPPEWWAAASQNQEALQIGYDASTPPTDIKVIAASFNNPAYWAVMDAYVTAVVTRYKSHPALLGWSPCIGMTRENNYGPSYLADLEHPSEAWGDYSPYAKGRFRSWLAEPTQYNNDLTALQSAWGDAAVTFDNAEPPLPQDSVTNSVDVANGAGDTRRQMRDWLNFRLAEKGLEWRHFVDLVKSLDENHIVAMNPADSLLASIGAATKNGAVDGLTLTRDAKVDLVLFHPRTTDNENEGAYNTQSFTLFAFADYARRLGKIGTFALEDNADYVNGVNTESLTRIDSLAPMLASAGGGMGWAVESSGSTALGSAMPVWSDSELTEIAGFAHDFNPATRTVTPPEIAILIDPINEQVEYTLGGAFGASSRAKDRMAFYRNLFNGEIRISPIEVAEVSGDPHVLDGFKGVIVADLANLDEGVAQILHDYAAPASGKGLLVAGRTGVFDADGNQTYAGLKTLLGLSSAPTSTTTSYGAWSFDNSTDPLLTGLAGQSADTGNLYYLPTASWTSTENGFLELGHAAAGTKPATLLKKDKVVAWLPRLDLTNGAPVVSLVNNWLSSLDTETAAANSIGVIGCSLTINALNGYHSLGGNLLWPGGSTGYAGGGLSVWVSQLKSGSTQGDYWSKFSSMLSQYPNPQAIWWELCPNADAPGVTYDDTVLALNEIKRLAPGATVYVTGVPIYPLDGTHCSINTDAGSQATLDLAGQLVANGVAQAGPALSLLTTAQVGDGCHANTEGEGIWGQNLLDFFGASTPTPASLVSIAVTPANPSVTVGGTQQFTATGTYSDNSTQNLTASVTWGSTNQSVATIGNGGLASTLSAGTSTISAGSGTVSGSTTLTVLPVTPADPTIQALPLNKTIQITGAARPEIIATGDRVYVVYLATTNPRSFNLIIYNRDLTSIISSKVLVATDTGTYGSPTDIRLVSDGAYVYAFYETVMQDQSYLFGAKYTLDDSFTRLAYTGVIVQGKAASPTNPQLVGDEKTDDPAPLLAGGEVYVMTRIKSTLVPTGDTKYRFRKFGTDLQPHEFSPGVTVRDLDLSAQADGEARQSSIIWADGYYYLTVPTAVGPSSMNNDSAVWTIPANLLMVRLDSNFNFVDSRTVSAQTGYTEGYVSGLRSDSRYYYLTYNHVKLGTEFSSVIKICDKNWNEVLTNKYVTVTTGALRPSFEITTKQILAGNDNGAGTATLYLFDKQGLASLAVTPGGVSLAQGGTQQFTATGTNVDGSTHDLTASATWTSSNPAVATIGGDGLATSIGTGNTTITATSGGIANSTVLTVIPGLVSVAVTPANPSIAKGGVQVFTATGTFSDNSTADLTTTATWSSSNPAAASIDGGGLATALEVGSSTITATWGGKSGSTTLTVSPVLVSIGVTPANSIVVAGDTQQFTATGTYSDSSTANLSSVVIWSSSNQPVASIGTGGLASALNAGTSTITASSSGITGSTSLTVTAALPQFVDGNGATGLNLLPGFPAMEPQLTVFGDSLFAAWHETNGTSFQIRLRRYDGNNWSWVDDGDGTGYGLNHDHSKAATSVQLTVFGSALYFTWYETSTTATRIRVRKYDGVSWSWPDGDTANGLNMMPDKNAKNPQLTVFNGAIYAIWEELNTLNISQIRVRKYDGANWSWVDSGANIGINKDPGMAATCPQLTVFNGSLYAIWQEKNGGIDQIRVKVYTGGTTWTSVDDGGTTGINFNTNNNGDRAQLTVYNNELYATWREGSGTAKYQIRVRKYNGTGWSWADKGTDTGINFDPNQDGHEPQLTVFGSNLYAIWCEPKASSPTARQVRVKKYDGSQWSWFDGGDDPVTNGDAGINKDKSRDGNHQQLTVYGGNLYATWWEATSGASQIRVVKFPSAGPTDNSPPTVAITAPVSGATISGAVTVYATATDNIGVTKVELYVDGVLKSSTTASPYSFSLDTTQLTNGAHNLTAKAYDGAGNSANTSTVSVTVTNSGLAALVLVTQFAGNTLYKLDPVTNSISSQLSFSANPGRPAADLARRIAYMTLGDQLLAVKPDTMEFATLTVSGLGRGGSFVSLSPDGTTLAVVNHGQDGNSSADDCLDIVTINPEVWPPTATLNFSVNVGTQPIRSLIDHTGRYAVVSVRNDSKILVVDLAAKQVALTIPLASTANPEGMDLHPTQNIAYVTMHGSNQIEIIDLGANPPRDLGSVAITSTMAGNNPQPSGGNFTPDGGRFYVSGQVTNEVLLFNTATPTAPVQDTTVSLPSAQQPHDIVFFPDGRAYVANTYNTQPHGNIVVLQNYNGTPTVQQQILTDVLLNPLYLTYVPAGGS